MKRFFLWTWIVIFCQLSVAAATETIKQGSSAYPLTFMMIDSSDHVSGKTGLSPTVKKWS